MGGNSIKLPTFSVVLANYNHGHYLPNMLQAIVSQSYQPMEIIIVDDASTDNSVEIIEGFVRKYPFIKLVRHEKNRGAAESEVHAMQYAKGDFLLTAGADDLVFPGLFERSAKLLNQYPHAGICTSVTLTIDEHNNVLGSIPSAPFISNSPCYFSPETVLKCLTETHDWTWNANVSFFRRDAFPEVKNHPSDASTFPLLSLNFGACFIPEVFGAYRILHNSHSAMRRRDPKVFQATMEGYVKLMETTYSGKFPPQYIEAFKKNIRYEAASLSVNVLSSTQSDCISQCRKSLYNDSFIDKVFLKIFQFLNKTQKFILKRYLFSRLGNYSWAYFVRIFNRYRNKQDKFNTLPKDVKLS